MTTIETNIRGSTRLLPRDAYTEIRAGIQSVEARGYCGYELVITPSGENGVHFLQLASDNGVYSDLPWQVTARAEFTSGNACILSSMIKVGSKNGERECTVFHGKPLAVHFERRINQLLAIAGARFLVGMCVDEHPALELHSEPTSEELSEFHMNHPAPAPLAAFQLAGGRAVLVDGKGRCSLRTSGECGALLGRLRRIGWGSLVRSSLPPASQLLGSVTAEYWLQESGSGVSLTKARRA